MSKVEKLNQRSETFCIVLNDSGADVFHNSRYIRDKLKYCEELEVIFVAVIKHDRDLDDDTKQLKTLHYHVVLQLDKMCRIGTMINKLVDLFSCNANQITIDKCNSLVMQVRYLIHLDDIDKYHYPLFDIETNDEEFVAKCFTYRKTIQSIDELITLVNQYGRNLLELMKVIGYENYKKYRVVINDIRKEMRFIL